MSDTKTQTGYLVLADISGYTSYLAATELEHAQEVVSELLALIVDHLNSLLTIVKLEGDAVFAYGLADKVPRGESLIELVESTYLAFRDHVARIVRRTTCECNACRAIPNLDLKFIAHFGNFGVQRVAGISELVGSDVNLVHRLLKNHISEATGWHAYLLLTGQALARVGVRPDGMHEQAERYEHLGEVETFSLDLRRRHAEVSQARRVFISAAEAHATVVQEFRQPPPVVWEWLNDPARLNQYSGSKWRALARPGGRTGVGARNHCDHGRGMVSVQTMLDWQPFDHFTYQSAIGPGTLLASHQLEPLPDSTGTRLTVHFKGRLRRGPEFIARILCRLASSYSVRLWENMARMMDAEAEQRRADELAPDRALAGLTQDRSGSARGSSFRGLSRGYSRGRLED